MKIKILLVILLTLVLFATSYTQTPDKAKLDRFFDRLAEKNKAMGSLTLAKNGNVLYSRAIGYSRAGGSRKKSSTAATRYRIGSISKMFTTVLVFQMVEKGAIELTDPLKRFFPQIPNAGKITITQMLAQPAGQSVFPLEATVKDKFKIEPRGIVLEFNASKNQMTFKRGNQELVFTKEK